MLKKIITMAGARPQFIKAAPVSKALGESCNYEEVMVHPGQHYDFAMFEDFFEE
jgi:UDP-N-acetylglucosamine 2-epimerase